MAKRKRSKRRGGMGSIITVRRGGMGSIWGRGPMLAIPPLIGGGATAAVAAGIRWFVNPAQGNMQRLAVKWSWLWATLVGMGISSAMYAVGGRKQGMEAFASSATASAMVGAGLFLNDWLLTQPDKQPQILAALASQASTAGMGAIVFQRPGTGAIVAEVAQPYLGAGVGVGSPYGETVSLQGGLGAGVDTTVFGQNAFG